MQSMGAEKSSLEPPNRLRAAGLPVGDILDHVSESLRFTQIVSDGIEHVGSESWMTIKHVYSFVNLLTSEA